MMQEPKSPRITQSGHHATTVAENGGRSMTGRLYPIFLQACVPADVAEAVEAQARRQRFSRSECVRRLILAGLEAQGVTLPDPEERGRAA